MAYFQLISRVLGDLIVSPCDVFVVPSIGVDTFERRLRHTRIQKQFVRAHSARALAVFDCVSLRVPCSKNFSYFLLDGGMKSGSVLTA